MDILNKYLPIALDILLWCSGLFFLLSLGGFIAGSVITLMIVYAIIHYKIILHVVKYTLFIIRHIVREIKKF